MDDQRLFREFVATGSDEAFTELVNRHLGLVYSTALRRLGNSHAAEEVTQSVFTLLAEKARQLRPNVLLAAWLYQSTCFKAAHRQRAEYRRLAREREAAVMQQINSPAETEAAWNQIQPLLDDAMLQLGEQDRAALLLRFFQQKRLREVGLALGVEEEAARKRVDRALNKLRSLLAARGITTSASALALVLNARLVETIPAVLASQLARSAFAAAGTTTTSTLGLLTLMVTANLKTAIAVFAGLLVSGAVAVKLYQRSKIGGDPGDSLTIDVPRADSIRRAPNPFASRPPTDSSASSADTLDPALAAALARVREVLNDPNPWKTKPDKAIAEAIAALGNQRKAAFAIVRAALKSDNPYVRFRAVDGLGAIGLDAKEAVPELIEMLRRGTDGGDAFRIGSALKQMGPSPELIPELVEIMKQNPVMRIELGKVLPDISGGDPKLVDKWIRPLLQDPDFEMRRTVAVSLAHVLRSQAGAEVVKVAIETLKSDPHLGLGLGILWDATRDLNDSQRANLQSVGPVLEEAVATMEQLVNESRQDSLRRSALNLLVELNPDIRREKPDMDAWLMLYEQTEAFTARIQHGQVELPELIERLTQELNGPLPQSDVIVIMIAAKLALLGPDGQAALPALREALAILETRSNLQGGQRQPAYQMRETIVNTIQKITPLEPKLLFTVKDTQSILEIVREQPMERATRRVVEPFLGRRGGPPPELTPDQVHRLLDALKDAPPVYEAVVEQVKKIDQHFFTAKPTP